MRRAAGWLADYPAVATGLVMLVVLAHYIAAQFVPQLNVAVALASSSDPVPRDILVDLALGVAGVAAMVGGFAGVVVVFGLGSEQDRFRLLRQAAGSRLRANWVSVVLTTFAAAFGAVVSAVVIIGFGVVPGLWLLELFLLVAAHGAIRLTALLAGLAGVVDEEDTDAAAKVNIVRTGELIPDKDKIVNSHPDVDK